MKITISLFLGEAGSIAGLTASQRALAALRGRLQAAKYRRTDAPPLIRDVYVAQAGEHVAALVTHTRGIDDSSIRAIVADAFADAARTGCGEGLCGLPPGGPPGDPAVAEIEFEERTGEACLFLTATMADRDVFQTLRAASKGRALFATVSRPCVAETGRYTSAMVIRAGTEFVPAADMIRAFAEPACAVPVHLGEPGFAPVESVACAAFCIHDGRITEAVDCFSHPYWDKVRDRVIQASLGRRTLTAAGV